MSKRFMFPQQHGERKKSKLDISISDHNFPLSQNKDEDDNWGDDTDDEILLLASQACEQAFTSNDISSLPDYSLCMQPTTTSTQMCDLPRPSTSKSPFTFKKPNALVSATSTTNLKDKCNRISSPLPGMLSKVSTNDQFTGDLTFNDRIYKDSDQVYRQLLQLQEENAKLKSENGVLQEKCVTKEGEASILRTQLKTCQVAVDNARMEKVRAQERLQMEWTEKLSNVNGQISDLRNQLDFKNLEIISTKERYRMLESSKVKLTQVTVGNNYLNSSHRICKDFGDTSTERKKLKTCNNSAQTTKIQFMDLHKDTHTAPTKLSTVLPIILEPNSENQLPLLIYNEKLQNPSDFSQNKCRIYSMFYRMPSTVQNKEERRKIDDLKSFYEDLSCIATVGGDTEKYVHIFSTAKQILSQTLNELEIISTKCSTAFQKEMDEKYINATSSFTQISKKELLSSRTVFKEEQALLSRRIMAILVYIVDSQENVCLFRNFEKSQNIGLFTEIISRICKLLDSNSCALLYSGLLLSITYLLKKVRKHNQEMDTQIIDIFKNIITSRPMYVVSCKVLRVLRRMLVNENLFKSFCPGSCVGNLKSDYDQGVLLYRKDSCYLQVLVKQIEASLKCIEKQNIVKLAAEISSDLIALFSNINGDCFSFLQDKARCDCRLVLMQVVVFSLRTCACMLQHNPEHECTLLPVCRVGLSLLHRCSFDVELTAALGYNEGHFIQYCEIMKMYTHDELHSSMLAELTSTFSSSPGEEPQSSHDNAWFNSFNTFSIAD